MSAHLAADRNRHHADQAVMFRAVWIAGPLLIVAVVVASLTGWTDAANVALSGTTTVAVAGPVMAAERPVVLPEGLGSPDDDPALCSVSGNGECGPGAPGGPVLVDGQATCSDPAATLIVNGAGVLVCDYRLISTAACDTDEHCAALQARLDERDGRVPAVAFGPAPDGGTAVSCPDGWEVDGSGVFDAHCVPTTDVVDA